jgi:hypothetical protein
MAIASINLENFKIISITDNNGTNVTDKYELHINGNSIVLRSKEPTTPKSGDFINYEIHYYDPIETGYLKIISSTQLVTPLLDSNNYDTYSSIKSDKTLELTNKNGKTVQVNIASLVDFISGSIGTIMLTTLVTDVFTIGDLVSFKVIG